MYYSYSKGWDFHDFPDLQDILKISPVTMSSCNLIQCSK